jgi:CTP-dependent riboflavin kinase
MAIQPCPTQEEEPLTVAIEAVPDITSSYLREQAERCRQDAEEARQRAKRLLVEATRLEREAEALAAVEALPPARPQFEPSDRAVLAGDVALHLAHHRTRQGKSSTELADHFAVSPHRMRAALELAIECGFVRRTGLKRGTRYWATDKAPEIPDPFGQRWHERVRDAAIGLGTFTLADVRRELPSLSEPTLRRWLGKMVEDGHLERERVGTANVYAYVEPEAAPVASPALREARRSLGSGVPGTGRKRLAGGRAEVRQLVRAAERQGATVRQAKHGHLVKRDGEVITGIPKTASDHRSLRNVKADFKRKGLDA